MDCKDYVTQYAKLLEHQATCTNEGTDNCTKTQKGRIQCKLRALKMAGHLDQATYNKIYLISDSTSRLYATSKIHKDPLNMQPITRALGPSHTRW